MATRTMKKSINNRKKAAKKKTLVTKVSAAVKGARALKARHLSAICAEIESQRCKTSGQIPRGEITKVLYANKPIYTWLTIDLIEKGLKKIKSTITGVLETIRGLTEESKTDNGKKTQLLSHHHPLLVSKLIMVIKRKLGAQEARQFKLQDNAMH